MDPKIINDRLARKNPKKTNPIADRFFNWLFKNTFKIGLWVTMCLIIIGAALQQFNIDIDPKPTQELSEEAKAKQEKRDLERQKKLTTWDSTEKSPTRRKTLEPEYDTSKKESTRLILGTSSNIKSGEYSKISKGGKNGNNGKNGNKLIKKLKMYKSKLTQSPQSEQSEQSPQSAQSNAEPEVDSSVVLTCGSKVNLEILGFGDLESYTKYTKPKKQTIIVGQDGNDDKDSKGKTSKTNKESKTDKDDSYSKYFSTAIGTEYIGENVTIYYPSKKDIQTETPSYDDIMVENVKITGVSPLIKIQPYWYHVIMQGEPIGCESSIRIKYRIIDAGDRILFEGTTIKFTIGNGTVPYQLEKAAFVAGLNGKFVTLLKSKDLKKINASTGVVESAVKFTPSYVNKNETIMIECAVQAGDHPNTHNNVGNNTSKTKRGIKNNKSKKDEYRQLKNF